LEEQSLLLTVSQAAKRLSIGRSHAYVIVMKGEIPSVKLGKSRRVLASDLEDYVLRLKAEQVA
jgi:excisionase family DNA binding protein